MTTDATALTILLAAFFGLILIRVPIAVALITASVTCGLYLDIPLVVLLQKMVSGLNSFTFLAVPFFIIAGELMSDGGMSDKIIKLADAVVGKVRGGLAMVNVLASMLCTGEHAVRRDFRFLGGRRVGYRHLSHPPDEKEGISR
jgi:TRAP-type mannitol/chloroaromatic compound transport system permease large subunit